MADLGKTRDILKQIVQEPVKRDQICVVKNVNTNSLTCDVTPISNKDIIYYNVKLSSDITGTNVNIPVIGSRVIITFLDNNQAYVTMFSLVEKFITKSTNADGVEESDDKQFFLDFTNFLREYTETLHQAIDNLTLKHPLGATIPLPINKSEFDQAKEKLDNNLDLLDNIINKK